VTLWDLRKEINAKGINLLPKINQIIFELIFDLTELESFSKKISLAKRLMKQ
jgi:hypothetical protein